MNQAYIALAQVEPVINEYFEHIMVMADDKALRTNRLAQMSALAEVIRSFAQFQAIVFA